MLPETMLAEWDLVNVIWRLVYRTSRTIYYTCVWPPSELRQILFWISELTRPKGEHTEIIVWENGDIFLVAACQEGTI